MQYDMVFEGGGAKGMVFVGAIQELERRGHTRRACWEPRLDRSWRPFWLPATTPPR